MQKDLQWKKNPTHWDKLLIIDDKILDSEPAIN